MSDAGSASDSDFVYKNYDNDNDYKIAAKLVPSLHNLSYEDRLTRNLFVVYQIKSNQITNKITLRVPLALPLWLWEPVLGASCSLTQAGPSTGV